MLPKFKPPRFKKFELKKRHLKPIIGKGFREKGKELELRIRRDLRKKGYDVSKAKNRHYDWLAKKGKKTYAVECKENQSSFSFDEIKFAIKETKKGHLIYMIAVKNYNRRIKYIIP